MKRPVTHPEPGRVWRVLVCGGRDFADREAAFAALDIMRAAGRLSVLIEGGARGADTIAREWAEDRGVPFKEYKADWSDLTHPDAVIRYRPDGEPYDARAGARRNTRMLDEGKPDFVIAFDGGAGTKNMTDQARRRGIEVIVPQVRERQPEWELEI